MKYSANDWRLLIDRRKQTFLSRRLERALSYLREARDPRKGWGAYPRIDTVLHSSALAIEALSKSGDEGAVGMIADAALYFRRMNEGRIDELGLSDLSELMTIAASQQQRDREYEDRILAALQQAYDAAETNAEELSIRRMSSAVLAVLDLGKIDLEMVHRWKEWLLQAQGVDGGWSSVPGQSSSTIVTAFALRVIARVSPDQDEHALQRGLINLRKLLGSEGWQDPSLKEDTFTVASVLRALAEVPGAPYGLIQDGIDQLFAQMNEDGGWGGGPGEPSSVEATALCVLSAVASGENTFVPARLVEGTLGDVETLVAQMTNERDKLSQEFDRRVQTECGLVVQERDGLKTKCEKLTKKLREEKSSSKRELEALRDRVRMVDTDLSEMRSVFQSASAATSWRRLRRRLPAFTFLSVFTAGVAGTIYALSLGGFSGWEIAVSAVFGWIAVAYVFVLSGALSRKAYRTYQPPSRLEDRTNLDSARSRFLSMAREWPVSLREEILYRLFRDVIDMPKDVGFRYAEEMGLRLDLPEEQANGLLEWLYVVLDWDPRERRLLFDQLRRAILR